MSSYTDLGYFWIHLILVLSLLCTVGVYVNLIVNTEENITSIWKSYSFIIGIPTGVMAYGFLYGVILATLTAIDYSVLLLAPITLIPIAYVVYMLITNPELLDSLLYNKNFPLGVLTSFTVIATVTTLAYPLT